MSPLTLTLSPSGERGPVNLRSVALGLLGVVIIAAIAPFNDWAVNNTYLIGSYLPVGVVLFILLFVMLVNGPLSRWKPAMALSGGELAVALSMMLVSCAVPGAGFMKYVTNGVVGLKYVSTTDAGYTALLREVDLPAWMFPANEQAVQDFWGRAYTADDSFIGHVRAVPWSAWAKPAIAWGIFAAAMWGAILCGAAIVRRQWVVNERLPFPLAGVYQSLIEPPARGRMLNGLLRSRAFWIAAGGVFVVHGLNALNAYQPRLFPAIPVKYDLSTFLASPPWNVLFSAEELRVGWIYFTVIGLTFFVQSNVALSMWFFFLALQMARGLRTVYVGSDVTIPMQQDQLFGGVVPYALLIVWVGRTHWLSVWRQMIGRARGDERAAGWGLIACMVLMMAWLVFAGASVFGAAVIVLMMLTIFLCIARIVAETGLMFGQLNVPLSRPMVLMGAMAESLKPTLKSFFFANFFTTVFTHDVRENLAVYSTHAAKIGDEASVPRRGMVACLTAALAVAFFVGGASQLFTEYTYAVTLDRQPVQPLSPWAAQGAVKMYTLDPTSPYVRGNFKSERHSRLGHFAFGAGLTTALSVLRLRFEAWPLHPVGFLLCSSYVMQTIWLSVLVGWLAKVLVLRFGGMEMFRSARTFFLGLVIGEAAAAGFWLVVSLVRVAMGLDYHAIRLFPA